jgi:hypothetical protein
MKNVQDDDTFVQPSVVPLVRIQEEGSMTHIFCIDRVALPDPPRLSQTAPAPRRCRATLLASCAFALAALALSGASANAGCNSGNVANTAGITSSGCQAVGYGGGATAVGLEASASYNWATAFGDTSWAKAEGSTGVGAHASALAAWSTAIGGGEA